MPRPLEATPPKSLRPDWPCRLLAPPPEVGPTSVSRSVMTPRRKCRDVISPRPQLSSVPSMSSLPAAALPGAMDPEFDDVVAPEDLMVRPRPLPRCHAHSPPIPRPPGTPKVSSGSKSPRYSSRPPPRPRPPPPLGPAPSRLHPPLLPGPAPSGSRPRNPPRPRFTAYPAPTHKPRPL